MNKSVSSIIDRNVTATGDFFSTVLGANVLSLPVPWLGGEMQESIFSGAQIRGGVHGFQLHETDELLVGAAKIPERGSPEETAREAYLQLLAATAGRELYRVWNYVPAINRTHRRLENYHAFCSGRSQAFEAAFGADFRSRLPAASAVGCGGDALWIVFVAGRAKPKHFENPQQVAAYHYPREHGERPPSFARATVARDGGRPLIFISGTAAIKGHVTVAPHSLADQLACTLDNLNLIGEAAGIGPRCGIGSDRQRHFKIYVRDPADYETVRARLEDELLQPQDRCVYLQADICRASLKLEIEVTLIG